MSHLVAYRMKDGTKGLGFLGDVADHNEARNYLAEQTGASAVLSLVGEVEPKGLEPIAANPDQAQESA